MYLPRPPFISLSPPFCPQATPSWPAMFFFSLSFYISPGLYLLLFSFFFSFFFFIKKLHPVVAQRLSVMAAGAEHCLWRVRFWLQLLFNIMSLYINTCFLFQGHICISMLGLHGNRWPHDAAAAVHQSSVTVCHSFLKILTKETETDIK